jgi:hypothetical protein
MPYRAAVIVALCLALLTSVGLARFGRLLPRKKRYALCAFAGIIILAETRFLSPVPFPLPSHPAAVPEVYRHIAESTGCGAVLDVPNEAQGMRVGTNLQFIYYQLHHGHPSLLHQTRGTPGSETTLFEQELMVRCGGEQACVLRPDERATRLDFEYVVLHEGLLESSTLDPVRAFLDDNLILERAYEDDDIRLYRTIDSETQPGPPFRRTRGLPDVCGEGPADRGQE